MTVISDTGPLIYLVRIGHLTLLKEKFGCITIPEEVYNEACVKGEGKPGSKEIKEADWIEIKEVKGDFLIDVLRLELDLGESEVIALAKQTDAETVVIDEKIPREKLKALGFEVAGTVGILVWASKEGLIPDLKGSLDDLRKKGMWISDELYRRALKMVEE
ncbi:MAG: DUF3368 domain-containing protein [Thermoplasmata archaeon]